MTRPLRHEEKLPLAVDPGLYAVCRLPPEAPVPAWAWGGEISSVTRTSHELSIVCAQVRVPNDIEKETGWRAIRVDAVLDPALTGVLAGLLDPLAEARISIFALSTFLTDYILIRDPDLPRALEIFRSNGHPVAAQ
jgi:hypothetical protein